MTQQSIPSKMPLDDFERPLVTPEEPLRDPSKASTGARILIVEDDIPLGKFLSRALKLKLFSVEVTLDGEAAWEALQKPDYDLVILDLNLPKIDGMDLLRQVRLTSQVCECWC